MAFQKAQSAMEYLMTYGWAILIIAILLVALAGLGLFDPMTYAAKSSPGACSVNRPQGAGTLTNIGLKGLCSGQIPKFAAAYTSNVCPVVGGVNTPPVTTPQLSATSASAITITFWFNQAQFGAPTPMFVDLEASIPISCTTTGGFLSCAASGTTAQSLSPISFNQWYFGAVTVDSSGNEYVYLNGQPGTKVTDGSWGSGITGITSMNIFSRASATSCIDGYMENVQVYTSALSANGITALYYEGIGGAPIDLNDLAGWWPLNGDVNDYSGNSNNAQAQGIFYSGKWWAGYATP